VFENRVLRRICGPKRDEVTGDWRKLHNEELHKLYPSPNIIRMIKSRRMRWAGHVAPNAYRIFFFCLICIVGCGIKVHSTLRPLNGLLCQPRVIMIMEKYWWESQKERDY
jgi:hypothetical protein